MCCNYLQPGKCIDFKIWQFLSQHTPYTLNVHNWLITLASVHPRGKIFGTISLLQVTIKLCLGLLANLFGNGRHVWMLSDPYMHKHESLLLWWVQIQLLCFYITVVQRFQCLKRRCTFTKRSYIVHAYYNDTIIL